MAQDTKQGAGSLAEKAPKRPEAESVDREPSDEPNPEHGLPVDPEDAPKGQPTSDRFQTEQAHRKGEDDAKGD
jgi:hypothetical protein